MRVLFSRFWLLLISLHFNSMNVFFLSLKGIILKYRKTSINTQFTAHTHNINKLTRHEWVCLLFVGSPQGLLAQNNWVLIYWFWDKLDTIISSDELSNTMWLLMYHQLLICWSSETYSKDVRYMWNLTQNQDELLPVIGIPCTRLVSDTHSKTNK